MLMNIKTRQSLDFDRVLGELLPISPFGAARKSRLTPYLSSDAEKLAHELKKVEEMKELLQSQQEIFREIKASLRHIKDIRRSVERCGNGGILNQVELFELKSLLFIMYTLHAHMAKLHWTMEDKYRILPPEGAMALLDPHGSRIRSFYLYDEYSERLQQLRQAKSSREQVLEKLRREAIQEVEKETGLKLKPTGEYVASKHQQEVLSRLAACSGLRQSGETFLNITYKIKSDKEMADCMKEIEELKGAELLEEAKVLEQLSEQLVAHCPQILKNILAIGEADLLIAKGELALRYDGIRPELTRDGSCSIKSGAHPIVKRELQKKNKNYIPISIELSQGVTLVTGANMGGKTVFLKMVGLLTAMAQYGLLVPAEHMSFEPFDFICISCGDEQSLDLGLSTFGGEIKSITEALSQTGNRGLLLLDELARGTNPKEAYAISYGIIEYLLQKPCISVITTHLEGLERPEVRHLRVKGLENLDFDSVTDYEDIDRYMDYSLMEVKGQSGIPQEAIKISKIMGLPPEIIACAQKIVNSKI
jgi:DNA mismatch repair protein MutS2